VRSKASGISAGAMRHRTLSTPAFDGVDEVLARIHTTPRDRLRTGRGHDHDGALAPTVLRLQPGVFDPSPLTAGHEDSLGLLVLDGLIIVELEAGRSRVGWLIGANDLIRPWQLPEIPIATSPRWRALTETRIAVLDHQFHQRAATKLRLIEELLARAAQTTHWLLAQSLLLSTPSVEERLLLWFALCGERWGRVTPDGVVVDLAVTHDLLGALVGAKRSTVTLALQSLAASGFLERDRTGSWLLSPESHWRPSNRRSCAADCANSLGLDLLSRTAEDRPESRSSAEAARTQPSLCID
jgi:CRP/FNR family transcriptional regulator, cyclic AMP receptor protein